jgi:hypothetical protein
LDEISEDKMMVILVEFWVSVFYGFTIVNFSYVEIRVIVVVVMDGAVPPCSETLRRRKGEDNLGVE